MNSFKLTPFWNCTLLRAMTNSLKNQLHILLLYTVYQCLAIVVIRKGYIPLKSGLPGHTCTILSRSILIFSSSATSLSGTKQAHKPVLEHPTCSWSDSADAGNPRTSGTIDAPGASCVLGASCSMLAQAGVPCSNCKPTSNTPTLVWARIILLSFSPLMRFSHPSVKQGRNSCVPTQVHLRRGSEIAQPQVGIRRLGAANEYRL